MKPRPDRSALSALGRRTAEPPISWLMDLALRRPNLISLAAGFTDNATLPVDAARELLNELLGRRRTGEPVLQYGNTTGLPTLLRLSSERLRRLDGAAATDESLYASGEFLITHGSQQFLYLLTEILCDPGDIVLLEDPTYFVFLGIAQSHGLDCRGVRLEADGLDVRQLEATLAALKRSGQLRRVKMLYLVSYYQNPTGTTTSLARKAAALDLLRHYERAAGHRLYLLEDAAYRELRFAGDDVPSTLTLPGAADRVIYASTYSKPFATGVRVGFARLPAALRQAAVRVKGNHDFGTASLLQHLVARMLAAKRYEAHLDGLRTRYAHKAAVMESALRRHFPAEATWRSPAGGMYFWATLPPRQSTGMRSRRFRAALDRDVLYVPGQLCYADDPTRPRPDHEMRLSFGNASLANIREGIARLGAVLRKS